MCRQSWPKSSGIGDLGHPMNILANIPAQLPEELTTVLQEGHGVRIERIVSTGHRSPDGFWYDQDQHEWVVVLKGAAKLEFEDRTVHPAPGDSIHIPAHTPHRVLWTTADEPTVWLAVFYEPRDGGIQ